MNKFSLITLSLWLLTINVKAENTLTVTILADDSYPPYSYLENGQVKGIYVEFIQLAAKKLQPFYQVKITAMPWKRGLLEIKTGNAFALIPPYKHFEKRPYMWPYSIALLSETVVAFCHSDVNITHYLYDQSNEIIPPLSVGINSGYEILNQELSRAKQKGTMIIRENKDTRSNIMKLLRKRLDCYLNDRFSTFWELKRLKQKFPEIDYNFSNINEALVVMTQTAHIGYSADTNNKFHFKADFTKRMDAALSQLYSSTEYHRILDKYIEP